MDWNELNAMLLCVSVSKKTLCYLRSITLEKEKRKEKIRRFKASLDNGESFKANFEPVNDFNWGMFKNEN